MILLGKVFDITAIRYGLDNEKEIESIIATKNKRLESLLSYSKKKGYTSIHSYLRNARQDMFTAFSHKLKGQTTSKEERVMRTVNMRTKMGKVESKRSIKCYKSQAGALLQRF